MCSVAGQATCPHRRHEERVEFKIIRDNASSDYVVIANKIDITCLTLSNTII
jgi:hypothetical protein